MIVASNNSPIINLAVVRQVHLLEPLYGKVYILEAVWQELSAMSTGQPWVESSGKEEVYCVEQSKSYNALLGKDE